MEAKKIINDISELPADAQRQVIDFIAFLKTRYAKIQSDNNTIKGNISDEKFIGIWKDRQDMEDSGSWLRNVRKSEWE